MRTDKLRNFSKRLEIGAAFLILSLIISSCAYSSLQPETYSRDAVQEMRNVVYGEVVKVKTVDIEGDIKSGALVGAVVGAAAGSGVSDGEIESSIGATLGAAVGSAVGSKLSQKITKKEGVQLTINLDDNRTVSVVQEVGEFKFKIGDLVELITIKGKTRVSPSQ